MANTYTRIYIHNVFAVVNRASLISESWKKRLHRYITGIVQNHGHKMIAVNTMPNHAHVFIGMKPHEALSDLIRDIKRDSTNFVKEEIHPRFGFGWQEGFGAFSYAHSQIDAVVKYIQRQEEHHRKRTFREEYEAMLKEFEVEYNPQFIFEETEDNEC